MSQKAALMMMKGVISDLPEGDQETVKKCAQQLRDVIAQHGDYGSIALALVGLEFAAADE